MQREEDVLDLLTLGILAGLELLRHPGGDGMGEKPLGEFAVGFFELVHGDRDAVVLAENVVDVVSLIEKDDVVAVVEIGEDVIADVRIQDVLGVTQDKVQCLIVEDDDVSNSETLSSKIVGTNRVVLSILAQIFECVSTCDCRVQHEHFERELKILRLGFVSLIERANVLDIERVARVSTQFLLGIANLAVARILQNEGTECGMEVDISTVTSAFFTSILLWMQRFRRLLKHTPFVGIYLLPRTARR